MKYKLLYKLNFSLKNPFKLHKSVAKWLCHFSEETKGGQSRKEFYLLFVPRKSLLCEKKLKVSGKKTLITHSIKSLDN